MSDIGGQAVIEGVMMRNKNRIAIAVRLPNGKIKVKMQRLKPKSKLSKLFFIRGVVNLADMFAVGIKALNWSALQQAETDDEEMGSWAVALTIAVSLIFAIALFMLLPYALAYLSGVDETSDPVLFNIIYGAVKAGILVLYVYLISLLKDIRRIFQYHGAEHKAVFCFEGGKELTAANAKNYPTLHPRCGTSFLMIVIIISVILFSFIPSVIQLIYPGITDIHWLTRRILFFTSRIALLPAVAGFSYELLKAGARHQQNIVFKALSLPGLLVQKLTAKEPTKKQMEVALAALKNAINAQSKNI